VSRFTTRREREAPPDSPEALFRTLRTADPELRHLWAHQADMLRAYQSTSSDPADVALELPTGAGKFGESFRVILLDQPPAGQTKPRRRARPTAGARAAKRSGGRGRRSR